MRPPEFWSENGRRAYTLEALLAPISLAYAWAGAERLKRARPVKVEKPVICIGNVTLGGAGKTPLVRALTKRLRDRGRMAHVLLRGHGGRETGPLRVDAKQHDAGMVGDEALLHACDGPTWISIDRVAGARAAMAAGADVVVLDDGFQNPRLAKDLSILAFDSAAGLGNGKVFPAGPLREKLPAALLRADAAVVIGAGETPWLGAFAKPVLRAALEPAAPPPHGKLVAFAGLGRPEKFFDTLANAGADVAEAIPFPDHHVYSAGDWSFLSRLAKERGALLITTEKDHVRLPPERRAQAEALPVALRFENAAALDTLLARILEAG